MVQQCPDVLNVSMAPNKLFASEPAHTETGDGHGSAVDWWTFGIFLYELLFGKTPFKGSGNRATLLNVVWQPLKFPESATGQVSFAARDLIRGLLVKEPLHPLSIKREGQQRSRPILSLKVCPIFYSFRTSVSCFRR